MTPAEIFLELLKPEGRPERQLAQYEALGMILVDPINSYLRGNRQRGKTSVDRWGTTILFPEDAPGATPHITPETKVCPDITHWRDYCHAPDLIANCSEGWEAALEMAERVRAEGKLAAGFMGTGIFEQCHFLMGFEDTLTNLYEHPQEMHELIEYILEYRLTYVKLLIDHLHPDVIFSHDDWGTKNALFMQSDVWREFFKEPYRKFYGYIRSRGCIAIHHADSYLVPIVDDMAEIGIQVWQGTLPENDIPALIRHLNGRMVLMGGIGAAIDRRDAGEAEIRAYVREALERYCPCGHYIPCITYGIMGTVFPQVDPIIDEEIHAYNGRIHFPDYRPAHHVRRVRSSAETGQAAAAVAGMSLPVTEPAAGTGAADDRLKLIADALCRGQKKKTVRLVEEALGEGISAQTILSEGLMRGMNEIGEAFTAGKVFVPEMLLAARCMTGAMELLKAQLTGQTTEQLGRVCLGTVRGDLHDIGKNLVKIMMEGAGIEVIDLGVDVTAETFVETAVAEKCDMICCSSLLTTAMPEMRRVVELSEQAGIRDRIRIMVGGAPISQSFCDEIGADIYTPDAAAAARAAVRALGA